MLTPEQQTLVEKNINLARKVAHGFIKSGAGWHDFSLSDDDLLAFAYLGLCHAAMGFDERRGCRFSTYAVPSIVGTIRHCLRASKPGGLKGISRSTPQDQRPLITHLEAPAPYVQDDALTLCLADVLAAADDVAEMAINRTILGTALTVLPEKQRRILELRATGHSQVEIARIFGLSQAQVSRTEQQAYKTLRLALGDPKEATGKGDSA